MTHSLEYITLEDLYIHDLNPRTHHDPTEVAAKAASILEIGLAQNLAGYADPAQPGKAGIVGGGYRLLALRSIQEQGHTEGHLQSLLENVPVQVTDDPRQAEAWAMATQHQADLNPAEEIRAYGQMADARGADPAAIARAYGVSETHVRRRLKLARLPDPILDALAAGDITLELASIYTTAPSPERAIEVFTAARNSANAHWIKRELHPDEISGTDYRAQFVGPDLYEAEGGIVTRSLFEDQTWFNDEALLDQITARKLADIEAEIAAEGWAFVWNSTAKYGLYNDDRIRNVAITKPPKMDLPEADQEELDRLRDTPHGHRSTEDDDRLADLETRARGTFDDEDRAQLGVIFGLQSNGKVERIEGLKPHAAKNASDPSEDPSKPATAPEPELSAALRTDLTAIATRTRQYALLDKTELALDLLTFALTELPGWQQFFALSKGPVTNMPSDPAGLADITRLADASAGTSPASAESFTAFRDKGKKHRNTALTEALARLRTLGVPELAPAIDALAPPEPRKVWSPTPAYFARLKGPMIDKIADQLLHDADPETLANLKAAKVKDRARELGALFEDAERREAWGLSRTQSARFDTWIPDELAEILNLPKCRYEAETEVEDAA